MAKAVRKKAESNQDIIVNQIVIRPVDRLPKDVRDWRQAHVAAESVVYANRTRLYDLYDDVMLDGHLTGITSKRVDAVLNKSLYYDVNGKKVDEFDDLIASEQFRGIITKIMESKYWGLSGIEFIPGPKFSWEEIPRKHIKPDLGIIATEQSGQDGFSYEDVWNLWIIGNKKDLGLLLKCSLYALYKRGNFADWAQFVEIFGQPVIITKYDAYDNKTKVELQQVMNEAGSSLRLMLPKQAEFDIKDGKQSNGDGKLQSSLKDACNNEMSVIILGNTETTTSSQSSGYAQSIEHSRQQMEITKSDLKFVQNLLSSEQFQGVLQSYGYPVAQGGKFCFEKEVDLGDLAKRFSMDKQIASIVPVADDYFYETYGVPKPDNYDQMKAVQEEERQARLNSNNNNGSGSPKKPAPKNQADIEESMWRKIRQTLADFFDPAP